MHVLALPSELVDEILSNLDLHEDLINFACTCRIAASYVVPRQIEYRTISIGHPMPGLWAHLASRPDLTCNIRKVKLVPDDEVFPRSWFQDGSSNSTDGEEHLSNMMRAFRHMTKLQTFICRSRKHVLTEEMHSQSLFSAIVSGKVHLKNLVVCEEFGIQNWPDVLNFWGANLDLSIIEYLQIEWTRYLPISLSSLFPSLDRLVYLCISGGTLNQDSFNFHAPYLRSFIMYEVLWFDLHNELATFLGNHPTIESIFWFPSYLTLPLGSLPNLKHIFGSPELMQSLEESYKVSAGSGLSPFEYEIESLHIEPCSIRVLSSLRCIDGRSLRKIRLSDRLQSPGQLRQLAERFPMIEWLAVHRRVVSRTALGEWLEVLPYFSNLETIRGLWLFADGDDAEADILDMAKQVAEVCPKLKRIQKSRSPGTQDIVVLRNEHEVQVLRDQNPPLIPRLEFDEVEVLILYN